MTKLTSKKSRFVYMKLSCGFWVLHNKKGNKASKSNCTYNSTLFHPLTFPCIIPSKILCSTDKVHKVLPETENRQRVRVANRWGCSLYAALSNRFTNLNQVALDVYHMAVWIVLLLHSYIFCVLFKRQGASIWLIWNRIKIINMLVNICC